MWIDNQALLDTSPIQSWWYRVPQPCIVLASTNKITTEVYAKRAVQAHCSILKRRGGGGTVYLDHGCAIWTIGLCLSQLREKLLALGRQQSLFAGKELLRCINQYWIGLLEQWLVANPTKNIQNPHVGLNQQGIADICWGNQKIVGTSLFQSQNRIVYQGSLLVRTDIDTIAGLLAYPSLEPDYRQGRSHKDFLTNLEQGWGYNIDTLHMIEFLQKHTNTQELYDQIIRLYTTNHRDI
jgi:lipoate---protein ligase